jgi:TolB protein
MGSASPSPPDRSGYWDLYVMDLASGEITQVTDSPHYDSAPSWSPDGQWLAFETYLNDNLEIAIVNVASGEIIPLTESSRLRSFPRLGARWTQRGIHLHPRRR